MTVWLPLEGQPLGLPSSPPFLRQSADPATHFQKVIKAITRARRIVGPYSIVAPVMLLTLFIVVSGAGISTDAGIPDFRSPEGLFQTLKKDNPKELLSSGKDLFDASVFNVCPVLNHLAPFFSHKNVV
jgi:NAD-dependent histone deacetylase SIR2